jgi:hypothetical protein
MHTKFQWIGYLSLLFLLAALLPVTKDGFIRVIKDSNGKVATERLKSAVLWLGAGVVILGSYVVLRMIRSGML